MILNTEKGGYFNGTVVRLGGSFRINGTSTPDTLRDGHSFCVKSVARVSAGLFTVTFDTGFPIPQIPINYHAHLSQVAVPTQAATAHVVVDSWSQSARTFQIACISHATTPTAVDPDDNDIITWEFVGSISSAGTDPA